MNHDPMCPWPNRESREHCMFCAALTRARADEAAKHHHPQQCCIVCGIHANPHRGGGCMLR